MHRGQKSYTPTAFISESSFYFMVQQRRNISVAAFLKFLLVINNLTIIPLYLCVQFKQACHVHDLIYVKSCMTAQIVCWYVKHMENFSHCVHPDVNQDLYFNVSGILLEGMTIVMIL